MHCFFFFFKECSFCCPFVSVFWGGCTTHPHPCQLYLCVVPHLLLENVWTTPAYLWCILQSFSKIFVNNFFVAQHCIAVDLCMQFPSLTYLFYYNCFVIVGSWIIGYCIHSKLNCDLYSNVDEVQIHTKHLWYCTWPLPVPV